MNQMPFSNRFSKAIRLLSTADRMGNLKANEDKLILYYCYVSIDILSADAIQKGLVLMCSTAI